MVRHRKNQARSHPTAPGTSRFQKVVYSRERWYQESVHKKLLLFAFSMNNASEVCLSGVQRSNDQIWNTAALVRALTDDLTVTTASVPRSRWIPRGCEMQD